MILANDADGFLLNAAIGAQTQPDWEPALRALLTSCKREVGAAFHSFYVRGSVACGTAYKGSSDLDAVLVLDDALGERRPDWAARAGDALVAAHPFITEIEVVVLGRQALIAAASSPGSRGPVMAQWCFLLGLFGRCLEGESVLDALGRFRAGPECAFVLRHLPRDLVVFEQRRASGGKKLCVWTAKKLLRAAGELRMLDDHRFTRDLGPCARRFAEVFPDEAATGEQLLRWAIAPVEDLGPLAGVAARIGPRLAQAAEARGLTLDTND